jgi:hypothetical protein
MPRSIKTQAVLLAGVAIWGIVVGIGVWVVHAYEWTPGRQGDPQPQWPAGSRLRLDGRRATLVMFAHPRCPCTRASVTELAEITAQARDAVAVTVLFFRSHKDARAWAETNAWRRAEAIAGVRVLDDPDGEESARFGAETSGSVLLYDKAGHLIFSGGITTGRGLTGPNPGRDAILALLSGRSTSRIQTPVFGCSLRDLAGVEGGFSNEPATQD